MQIGTLHNTVLEQSYLHSIYYNFVKESEISIVWCKSCFVCHKQLCTEPAPLPTCCSLLDDLQFLDSAICFCRWRHASFDYSHSRAIGALQLNSCTTVKKAAITAGSKEKWESSNILCRVKTTVMARCELAQVIFKFIFFKWVIFFVCLFFFPGCSFSLSYVRVILNGCSFCGRSTINGGLITGIIFVVLKRVLNHLWFFFSEDCFVAWLSSYCKNKEHLCEMMLHTVLHDSFLSTWP